MSPCSAPCFISAHRAATHRFRVERSEPAHTGISTRSATVEVLGDSAYGSAATRKALAAAGHEATIKPIPLRHTVPGGFTLVDFTIDTAAGTVVCPAGHTVKIEPAGRAQFRRRCQGCPLRSRCTSNKGGRSIQVNADFDVLHAARRAATDPAWQLTYTRWRPMVERTIAWIVAKGHRRVRYRGIARNQLWLDHRVAAVNLRQLIRGGLTHNPSGWVIAEPLVAGPGVTSRDVSTALWPPA